MNAQEHSYLIIGGSPKAGTTSLFKYLADHPQVCASSLKETRFFLDADYPLPVANRFDGTNLEAYTGFFRHCQDVKQKLMVEATPDYLYSMTALRIADLLPMAKIVFVLRDPVERMLSWYKFARQRGQIESSMSFEDYVMYQVNSQVVSDTPTYLRALEQGRYEKYLPAMREAFGNRCLTIGFDDLKSDPGKVMNSLCAFSGLDASFYSGYHFTAENVSHTVRKVWLDRGYRAVRRGLAYTLHSRPMLMGLLRGPNDKIKKLLSVNHRGAEDIVVPPWLADLIREEVAEK